MQTIQELRKNYDANRTKKESDILTFNGVNGRDVYNCSVPFNFDGKEYILGRVEKRDIWANSVTYLFYKGEDGQWYKVNDFDALPLEDPFYTEINGEVVVGGTHVVKECGKIKTYYAYFYKGKDIFNLRYFTTGPDCMKDIRFVQLPDNKVGVFSRPRSQDLKDSCGHEAQVGFTVINSLDELTADVILKAEYIKGLFYQEEWGGFNQVFYLGGNLLGAIGHQSYTYYIGKQEYACYLNTAYLFDYLTKKVLDRKVIGSRADFPEHPPKIEGLRDCVFTSGIIGIDKEFVELYSGLSDAAEGKVIIKNPFINAKEGKITV